jgi:phage repressor protein C with HTH and peptisase S24 domain
MNLQKYSDTIIKYSGWIVWCIIFIDRTKNECSKEGIYAFTTPHGLFVKRIQKRVDGKLDVISDNKEYPVQIVMPFEIEVLGKVVGSFGMVY